MKAINYWKKMNMKTLKKWAIIIIISSFALGNLALTTVGIFLEPTIMNVKDAVVVFTQYEKDFSWKIEGYKELLDISLEKLVY